MKDAISMAQCRAARALLGWSRDDLANASGVPSRTLADFELGNTRPHASTVARVVKAFQEAGVTFIPSNGGGEGVRFSAPSV